MKQLKQVYQQPKREIKMQNHSLQEGYVLSGLLIAEIMASIKENSILGYTVVPYLFE